MIELRRRPDHVWRTGNWYAYFEGQQELCGACLEPCALTGFDVTVCANCHLAVHKSKCWYGAPGRYCQACFDALDDG